MEYIKTLVICDKMSYEKIKLKTPKDYIEKFGLENGVLRYKNENNIEIVWKNNNEHRSFLYAVNHEREEMNRNGGTRGDKKCKTCNEIFYNEFHNYDYCFDCYDKWIMKKYRQHIFLQSNKFLPSTDTDD